MRSCSAWHAGRRSAALQASPQPYDRKSAEFIEGTIPAVRNQHVYEVKSTLILQPGPAALTDGIRHLQQIIMRAAKSVTR